MRKCFIVLLIIATVAWDVNSQDLQVDFSGTLNVKGSVITGDSNSYNLILGYQSGLLLNPGNLGGVDGTGNTFLGYRSGNSDASAINNTYVGSESGANVTDNTSENTFIGYRAGLGNSGDQNTFVGTETGIENSAIKNVFVGYRSGFKNMIGEKNTFLGYFSGRENIDASNNTFIGYEAGCENTEGDQNTMIGAGAGYFNATGVENVFIGRYSGQQNISGSKNIFIGTSSALDNLRGMNNTFIGNNTIGSDVDSSHNQIVLGYNAVGQGDNMAVIGNGDITDIYMNQLGSGVIHANATIVSSDQRLKKNVEPLNHGLAEVLNLNPVSYQYISDINEGDRIGFIAQDVQETIPDIVIKRDNGYLGINYQDLIPVLTKAIQEHNDYIKKLESSHKAQIDLIQLMTLEFTSLKEELIELRQSEKGTD